MEEAAMATRPRGFVAWPFLAVALAATGLPGCESGGGAAPTIGSACDAQDSGTERCNGTMNLKCEAQGDGYAWVLKKDCADSGRVCSDGDCVAATSGGAGGDASSGGPDAATAGGCAYESHLVVSDGEGSTDMGWGWHCDPEDAPATCTDDQQSSESCSQGTCYNRYARSARWVDDCEAFLANPPET
jgi:hypothetical protein